MTPPQTPLNLKIQQQTPSSMGKKKKTDIRNRSKTLPSSPTHSLSSSSSSDFEFRNTVSPRKSSAALCPADELFYKGQLLPLHLSPRISMVRNLLASSSTSSSSDTTTTASRDSSSSNDSTSSSFATDLSLLAVGDTCCDSSRPSSVTDDDKVSGNNHHLPKKHSILTSSSSTSTSSSTTCKFFSLSRFSNVFKKDPPITTTTATNNVTINNNNNSCSNNVSNKSDGSSVKKMSSTAKEVISKYMKKVKPFYEKISSSKQDKKRESLVVAETTSVFLPDTEPKEKLQLSRGSGSGSGLTTSFSGNLKCPKMIRKSCVASCPSSMRSSPSHSGVLSRAGMPVKAGLASYGSGSYSSDTSTMEELQSAIQGAIAHCKNSMIQTSTSGFNNDNNKQIHNNSKGKAIDI